MNHFDYTDPLKPTLPKSPVAELDYSWNFTEWLAGDVISTFSVTADDGLTVLSQARNGAVVTAFAGGGALGRTYRLRCEITTVGARTDERSIYLKIVDR